MFRHRVFEKWISKMINEMHVYITHALKCFAQYIRKNMMIIIYGNFEYCYFLEKY